MPLVVFESLFLVGKREQIQPVHSTRGGMQAAHTISECSSCCAAQTTFVSTADFDVENQGHRRWVRFLPCGRAAADIGAPYVRTAKYSNKDHHECP